MTVSEKLIERCVREYVIGEKGCGDDTADLFRASMNQLVRSIPYELDELRARDVVEYMAKMRTRELAKNTVATFYWSACNYWRWARKAKVIDADTFVEFQEIAPAKWQKMKPRPYSKKELATFFRILNGHPFLKRLPRSGKRSTFLNGWLDGKYDEFRRVQSHMRRLQFDAQIALALEHGLRRCEIGWSTIAQVHPDNRAVITRCAKRGRGVIEFRETPFTVHSRKAIGAWVHMRQKMDTDHDSLWLKLDNKPLLPQARPNGVFEYWDKKAPDVDWCWHRFRHTFGTAQLRAGVPIDTLKELMGHSNIQSTLIYAKITAEDVLTRTEAHSEEFERLLGFG